MRISPSSRSRSRSTFAAAAEVPRTTSDQAQPPNSSPVSPSRYSSWPSSSKATGVRRSTSSMTPSTATTGVGWIAASPVWLYSETLPPVTGVPELQTAVRQTARGLRELPHDLRVLRGTEVQAVRDRQRLRAGGRHVAVRLRQRQLRARVRVELGVPAVAVGRHRDAQARLRVDADHARVLGHRQDGVALHEAVVLLGDPRLGRRFGEPTSLRTCPSARPAAGPGQLARVVRLERVLPGRAGVRALETGPSCATVRGDVDDLPPCQ
ncbi:hypothetical protein STENM327S_01645 [Streptomyces tendae]